MREIALGLVDLGIQPGDKVAILANTRPEWTSACFGILTAGGALVTIYQTNSAEECQYVLAHSDSRAVFVEDGDQLAKIHEVRDRCPELRHVIVMEPGRRRAADGELTLDELRERGAGRDESEWRARYEAVTPDDVCLFIYTSGTTGPPKGCLLSHGNYRAITDAVIKDSVLEDGDSAYLFLPLAHAFAILIQFTVFELGVTLAYWSRDAKQIIPDLTEVKPSFFPSVPRMFEKIYTLATNAAPDREQLDKAVELGVKVRMAREAGEDVPAELETAFEQADEALYKNVRALFGGRIRECVTGAAPIAPEILRFFYACGVPVMEGYGMTETSTSATVNRPTADNFRFGSVGRPQAGVEVKIADDGEVLIKGPNIFQGYYKNESATAEALEDRWLHTGDLGRLDDDGFLYITGRKKDIIITAGGKNITPGEPGERAQAEPLDLAGRGGGRPPAVPGRADHARRRGGPRARGAARRGGSRHAARRRARARRDPEGRGRGELARRAGRADQALRDPARGPLPGGRRAHADAEGQAQRGARQVRRRDRRRLRARPVD